MTESKDVREVDPVEDLAAEVKRQRVAVDYLKNLSAMAEEDEPHSAEKVRLAARQYGAHLEQMERDMDAAIQRLAEASEEEPPEIPDDELIDALVVCESLEGQFMAYARESLLSLQWHLNHALDELHHERSRTKALLDLMVRGEIDPKGFGFCGPGAAMISNLLIQMYRDAGGENYMAMSLRDSKTREVFELLIRRRGGKTPSDVVAELRIEVEALKNELAKSKGEGA